MKTILLIEDNTAIRDNLAELLGRAGYAVQPAPNGRAGVELALAQPPALVLCDIMIPGLDGYGVLATFAQHPQLAGVPFIFLTAKIDHVAQRRGMVLSTDDYLTKPFAEDELLSAITNRLLPTRAPHIEHNLLNTSNLSNFLDDARATARLDHFAGYRKPHALRHRQDVYLEGDEATRAYFVQAGRIKTLRTNAEGKELLTGLYGPGEFFGYLPLLEHTLHRDSAVAVVDSELIYIAQDDFMLLLHSAEVGQQFMRLLAQQVSEREQQLLDMAYHSIRRRVADVLLRLHAQAGGIPGATIQLAREDLAALVGTAPESLIRTLSEFKQSGLLELLPKSIRVLDPDKLNDAHW